MRLEPIPRPEQTLHVSTRLITSSTILHLSADELERAVNQEQIENPAFDVAEQSVCLFCGAHLYDQTCSACRRTVRTTSLLQPTDGHESHPQWEYGEPQWAYQQQTCYDIDNSAFAEADSNDEYDPLAHIPTKETLADTLLQQLETLVTPDDALIAEQLVGNLNEHGYLEISVLEMADHLQVPVERVEYVLSQLQTLEPLGIGARTPRECLLIQLAALSEQTTPHPLAYTLIDRYLDLLGHNQFHEIARRLKVSEQELRQASQYIRSMLHPYPAYIYKNASLSQAPCGTQYIRPDVILRKGETGFEIELLEEKRYQFHTGTSYVGQFGQQTSEYTYYEVQRYMHHQSNRAKFFINCIQRRWQTLKRVAELVTDYQREFLDKGVRYLRPLTRAEVATRLSLDEGTVSRATANKYVLLPNGRLIPFSDFFDGSLGIKDILRELIQSEEPKHRLSDEELARLLTARGIPVARRTVTKYREEMGLGSSRQR